MKPFNSQISDPPCKEDKDKRKGKEVVKEVPKGWNKCFKYHGYGHFQDDCPNRRVLTVKEIEDLDWMELKEDEEEFEVEGETSYPPPEEGEMLMIKRVLYTIEAPPEASQGE